MVSTAMDERWEHAWGPFFLSHALPLMEEQAFRAYLGERQVPDGTSIQDLTAHYDQFLAQWEPGQTKEDGGAHG